LRAPGALGAAALAAVLAVTGCSADGEPPAAEPSSPPASSEAPLLPSETALPSELPSSVTPSRADLAKQAERLARDLPWQQRPQPLAVAEGATTWQVGQPYRGTFADPDIVRHRGRWFAYATNTASLNLPTLVSRDLRTWTPASGDGSRYDALPQVGGWVTVRGNGRGLWAPSVARIGGAWTAAYSAQAATVGGRRHNCIGLARGSGPAGPFRPVGRPICSPNAQLGLIDPDLYVDGRGRAWLLWKFSGVVDQRPAGLFIRRMNADGTDFAAGAVTRELLRKELAWEGNTIENPSMVEFQGVTYLFYSGNSWTTTDYATSYAICSGPTGPCVRPSDQPLLSSASTGNLGSGGASAFVAGAPDSGPQSLRLIYHAWDPGLVGERRRLHVAGLWQRDDGTLEVVDPG
jgi:beta-xylosidase